MLCPMPTTVQKCDEAEAALGEQQPTRALTQEEALEGKALIVTDVYCSVLLMNDDKTVK